MRRGGENRQFVGAWTFLDMLVAKYHDNICGRQEACSLVVL